MSTIPASSLAPEKRPILATGGHTVSNDFASVIDVMPDRFTFPEVAKIDHSVAR